MTSHTNSWGSFLFSTEKAQIIFLSPGHHIMCKCDKCDIYNYAEKMKTQGLFCQLMVPNDDVYPILL